MNDQDWIKGQVDKISSDVPQLIEDFENQQPKKLKDPEVKLINPGRYLLHKVMNKTKEVLNKEKEDEIRELLQTNYQDHLAITKYVEEESQLLQTSKAIVLSQKDLQSQKFFSMHDTSTNRTLWSGYSGSDNDASMKHLINLLPLPFKQELTESVKPYLQFEYFSVIFISYKNEIPPVVNKDEATGTISERSFKVPSHMSIEKIVAYLFRQIGIKDYILATDKDTADPTDFLELGIQLPDKKITGEEFFLLDNRLALQTVFSYLYDPLNPITKSKNNPIIKLLFKQRDRFLMNEQAEGQTPGQP